MSFVLPKIFKDETKSHQGLHDKLVAELDSSHKGLRFVRVIKDPENNHVFLAFAYHSGFEYENRQTSEELPWPLNELRVYLLTDYSLLQGVKPGFSWEEVDNTYDAINRYGGYLKEWLQKLESKSETPIDEDMSGSTAGMAAPGLPAMVTKQNSNLTMESKAQQKIKQLTETLQKLTGKKVILESSIKSTGDAEQAAISYLEKGGKISGKVRRASNVEVIEIEEQESNDKGVWLKGEIDVEFKEDDQAKYAKLYVRDGEVKFAIQMGSDGTLFPGGLQNLPPDLVSQAKRMHLYSISDLLRSRGPLQKESLSLDIYEKLKDSLEYWTDKQYGDSVSEGKVAEILHKNLNEEVKTAWSKFEKEVFNME